MEALQGQVGWQFSGTAEQGLLGLRQIRRSTEHFAQQGDSSRGTAECEGRGECSRAVSLRYSEGGTGAQEMG